MWFASSTSLGDGGRFELPDSSGFGTCYLETAPVGAYLEKFGRIRTLTDELLLAHRLFWDSSPEPEDQVLEL